MSFLKSINDRLKSCDAVEQAVLNHGQRIAAILNETFAPLLEEGWVSPDFWITQQLLLKQLLADRDVLTQAETFHIRELANDTEPRSRRRVSFSSLSNGILDLRTIVEGLYRPENIESLGFPARLARDSKLLLRQGEHLVEELTGPDLQLPESRFASAQLPVSEMVQTLVPRVDELREALGDVGREERLAQATLVDRDRAKADYDRTFLWVARTLESFYNLSGETELAARVRPSTRRAGRTERQVVAEGGEEAANEPSTAPTDDTTETA